MWARLYVLASDMENEPPTLDWKSGRVIGEISPVRSAPMAVSRHDAVPSLSGVHRCRGWRVGHVAREGTWMRFPTQKGRYGFGKWEVNREDHKRNAQSSLQI